jgi:hypothetical protein
MIAVLVALLLPSALAFSPSCTNRVSSSSLNAVADGDDFLQDRRNLGNLFWTTAAAVSFAALPQPVFAEGAKKVFVAGATGQTGRRVLERLAGKGGLAVVAGVRNPDKAAKALAESSTVVRGAMIQQVASVDTSGVEIKHLDVVKDTADQLAETLSGADSLVIVRCCLLSYIAHHAHHTVPLTH